MQIPNPPESSVFHLDIATDSLTWRPVAGGSLVRIPMALFMLFWLCGWAFGEVMVIKELVSGKAHGTDAFLLAWLGAWTIGGIFASFMVFRLLKPGIPDVLKFEATTLQYTQGRRAINPLMFNRQDQLKQIQNVFQKSRSYNIEKTSQSQFRLERVGERQRLSIDIGSERVEIGEDLREPEREWLHNVLMQWKSG